MLLCDLDDTLMDRTGNFARWANEWAGARNLDAEFVTWLTERDEAGYRPRAALWADVKARLYLAEPVEALVDAYQRSFVRHAVCSQSVLASLADARARGWTIAILTNGEAFQHEKIDNAGLRELVHDVLVSGIEGIRKPDPRFYELAASRCGLSLEGAWMIGDNPSTDIAGAVACNIHSVWLSMGRVWPSDLPFEPTHSAASFPEAVALAIGHPQD